MGRVEGKDDSKHAVFCLFSAYLSPVVHLNNADTTCDLQRRPINPHNSGDTHLSIQCDASSEVDKGEQVTDIIRLPLRLLITVLEVGSRSAHGDGDLGVIVGEGEGHGFWGGDNAEDIWRVGDLEPEA